jgi:hypothetical protein
MVIQPPYHPTLPVLLPTTYDQVIAHELEFINKQAKGQQAKGKDRQRRYDDLVTKVRGGGIILYCGRSGCVCLRVGEGGFSIKS